MSSKGQPICPISFVNLRFSDHRQSNLLVNNTPSARHAGRQNWFHPRMNEPPLFEYCQGGSCYDHYEAGCHRMWSVSFPTKSTGEHSCLRGCFNFWRMNCMLSGHVHTLGHIELTQFCQYTGDKLIMILHAIHSPEVETSS